MRRNCTYFSFKIYQLKQILDGLECSNPTHVNADHSRHPSEGIVTLAWAKIVFSGQCLLPNQHPCSLYLSKIVNDGSKSNYSLSQQSYLHLPTASSSPPTTPINSGLLHSVKFSARQHSPNETLRHPELFFPCITSLLHRFVDELTVERSTLLLTSKDQG